jgi:hypothetical protein
MIGEVKEVIKSAIILGGISNIYTHLPERPVPPCAIIEPDDNFITVHEDEYDAAYTSNWKIRVMVPTATNSLETSTLDSYLDDLIPTIWEHTDCGTLTVDKPFLTEANGAIYLTTYLNISIDMQGGN